MAAAAKPPLMTFLTLAPLDGAWAADPVLLVPLVELEDPEVEVIEAEEPDADLLEPEDEALLLAAEVTLIEEAALLLADALDALAVELALAEDWDSTVLVDSITNWGV